MHNESSPLKLFRNDYSLEEIENLNCHLCCGEVGVTTPPNKCGAFCRNCRQFNYHFRKVGPNFYKLYEIVWEIKKGKRYEERRFYEGFSYNTVFFRASYPMNTQFEIEKFDLQTLERIDRYMDRRMELQYYRRENKGRDGRAYV